MGHLWSRTWAASLVSLVLLLPAAAVRGEPPPALKDRIATIAKKLDAELASLQTLYKHLHAHPELSLQEEQTAARLAKELKGLGFEVTEKVGGTGVVGVLKNGDGPTVLVRTDMDALPVIGEDRPALRQQGPHARQGTATRSASCTPAATTCT